MLFYKAISALRAIFASARHNALEKALLDHFEKKRSVFHPASPDAPRVAVIAMPQSPYYGILGEIVADLRQIRPLRVDLLDTLSLLPGAGYSLAGFLRARVQFNPFSRRKWEHMYDAFCDRIVYRSADWVVPWRALNQWQQAWHIWRSLRDNDQLAATTHGGILIGDLVIDTYLRMRPTAKITLSDRYLLIVIRQALKDLDLACRYFRRERPSVLFSTYAVYVQHGVPVRAALACGVRVITFGNLQEFCTLLSDTHYNHTKDTKRYSAEFNAMPDRIEKAAQAEQMLNARLSGSIDAATVYMKKSAYAVTRQDVPDVLEATVVFLHDFYDSVHIYSWILFHDFWEWICFTTEALQASGRKFWLKPHPNQAAESSAEIEALRTKYPEVKFLPSDVTNRQLVDAGMACAVTVYGSVASEMAFMGIPCISTGDNPHASFDAFHVARSRSDYASALATPPNPLQDRERRKAQACAFYYMHNMNLDAESMALRDWFTAVWAQLFSAEANDSFDAAKITATLGSLAGITAFRTFSETLFSDHPC